MKAYIFNEAQEKWLTALESGEYQQTSGVLKDTTGYCCLGVACELDEELTFEEHINPVSKDRQYRVPVGFDMARYPSYEEAVAPDRLLETLKLLTTCGDPFGNNIDDAILNSITEMNDGNILGDIDRHSFKEIAAVLRANPLAYFEKN